MQLFPTLLGAVGGGKAKSRGSAPGHSAARQGGAPLALIWSTSSGDTVHSPLYCRATQVCQVARFGALASTVRTPSARSAKRATQRPGSAAILADRAAQGSAPSAAAAFLCLRSLAVQGKQAARRAGPGQCTLGKRTPSESSNAKRMLPSWHAIRSPHPVRWGNPLPLARPPHFIPVALLGLQPLSWRGRRCGRCPRPFYAASRGMPGGAVVKRTERCLS